MSAVTLSTLRTRARSRADMEDSDFISDSQLNQFINDSNKELHDLLVQKFGSDYRVSSASVSITSGVGTLTTGFMKLLGVDMVVDGLTRSLKKFQFAERAAWRNSDREEPRYRLEGSQLRLLPNPGSTSVTIWYIPEASELSADGNTVDFPNGWEEYIVVDAAIKMRVREESETQELMIAKAGLLKRIEEAAENRDAGAPEKIVDLAADDCLDWT